LHPTFSPFTDTLVIHWPKANLMAQSWQAGEGLPHWTPLILSGMPLAANQLAMLSYPPTWLFLILPLEPTFNLLFIFHLWLGGLGIYYLLHRGHNLATSAALLGGLAFALNGKMLAHTAGGHVSMVAAFVWLPWLLLGVHMLLRHKTSSVNSVLESKTIVLDSGFSAFKWAAPAAVALAMQAATHTLPVIHSVYLLGAMVVWHFVYVERRQIGFEVKRLITPLLLIPISGLLLSAGQLLPLLELAPFSNRALSLEQAAEYSLTPAQLLLGLVLPSGQGGHELVIYLGLIPLILLPFGVTRRQHWSLFYAGVFLFVILFALGPSTPLHGLFYQFAPGFGWVRTPARIFFVGAVAAAVLVGFAVDRLSRVEWSSAIQKYFTLVAVALSALAVMFTLGLALGFSQLSRATIALAIFTPAGLGIIALRVRGALAGQLALTCLGLLLFLDLAWFDHSLMRFVAPEEAFAPGRAAAAYLARKPGYFRVYSPSYSLPMQTAAAHNLTLADGVEPVHLAVYDHFMARAGGYNDSSFSVTIPPFDGPLETALKDVRPNLKLLGLLNVTYLASAFPIAWPGLTLETEIGGTYIYANDQALPRAWVAHQTIPTQADWLTQLERLPNLDDVALVERGPYLNQSNRPASPTNITRYTADVIELETLIAEPGWLVVSEIWYPGWQATVNGLSQPVEKVDGLLRGVYLNKPGRYQIRLEYRPQRVVWGNWVAGVTAMVMIMVTGLLGLKTLLKQSI
jgi:hypothetical protein